MNERFFEKWYMFALEEIEQAAQTRRLDEWAKKFVPSVRRDLEEGKGLTKPMQEALKRLHEKMTSIKPIPRYRR